MQAEHWKKQRSIEKCSGAFEKPKRSIGERSGAFEKRKWSIGKRSEALKDAAEHLRNASRVDEKDSESKEECSGGHNKLRFNKQVRFKKQVAA
mmetsp:Transcript_24514/g.42156  ORF Transcript_24514/g.42156 Transcript_24514/m.42156 type:complete len:93 (-) Transcript_24514:189-467(-)|eukprot:CAMPEP_0196666398 /NCGR_PEP_ID=MMETSP1086-20130531/64493_1 /TAXON_ID=77921 /ORGANISM="Cyanoptyche  gloeocystis , Strain SAG4.97" /LENGTH=92 /DNA_ID=CAMNT_0042003587 /DNA_START=436 /DNA_END=714 /DNA_ORIENTATION=+